MPTIDIIIACDCPLGDFLDQLELYNLKIVEFIAQSSSGGNPELTLSGTPENLAKFEHLIYHGPSD